LRLILLACAIFFYFTDAEILDFTEVFQKGIGGAFLWIVWVAIAFGMMYRIFPNTRVAIGARKHFKSSFRAAYVKANLDVKAVAKQLNKSAILCFCSWFAVTALILLALFFLDALTPPIVLIIMLTYAVADMAFIVFLCPFQKLFMKNSCCTTCRIYNWDYFMMCVPMLVMPGFYSVSLALISAIILLRWEIAFRKSPHFFMSETNENLRCGACVGRLCKARVFRK